ncbi:MAG: hypothetical protein H6774_03630 [Pseudomonadales bacterium]|nr:hypothetical protein [Pseudomonadales bacterium]
MKFSLSLFVDFYPIIVYNNIMRPERSGGIVNPYGAVVAALTANNWKVGYVNDRVTYVPPLKNVEKPKVRGIKHNVVLFDHLKGSPDDIFSALKAVHQDPLRFLVGSRVDLLGATDPHSMYEVAQLLAQVSFEGQLIVTEREDTPVFVAEQILFDSFLGLPREQIKLHVGDVLSLDKDSASSAMIADVLTYYLSDQQLQNIANIVYGRLDSDGYFFCRDLVEVNGPPPVRSRTISTVPSIATVGSHLRVDFNLDISDSDIENIILNRWGATSTYCRADANQLIEQFSQAGLEFSYFYSYFNSATIQQFSS